MRLSQEATEGMEMTTTQNEKITDEVNNLDIHPKVPAATDSKITVGAIKTITSGQQSGIKKEGGSFLPQING